MSEVTVTSNKAFCEQFITLINNIADGKEGLFEVMFSELGIRPFRKNEPLPEPKQLQKMLSEIGKES